jgi:TnpA family transposase
LDEILDNETELPIFEHTTDTAGYTELVFALFHLLGMQFSPRLRDLSDQTLYSISKDGASMRLIKATIRQKLIIDHYDDLLRVAGSLKIGWVTASLLISKLQAYPQQNILTQALQECGRVVKTISVLKYLTDKNKRRYIMIQLNKGEAIHSLREKLFFANQGVIRKHHLEDQAVQLDCLNLVTNMVITWNTVYMQAVIEQLKQEGYPVREEDIVHLSPARHEHINFYGNYFFNISEERTRKGLRPLRKP